MLPIDLIVRGSWIFACCFCITPATSRSWSVLGAPTCYSDRNTVEKTQGTLLFFSERMCFQQPPWVAGALGHLIAVHGSTLRPRMPLRQKGWSNAGCDCVCFMPSSLPVNWLKMGSTVLLVSPGLLLRWTEKLTSAN